MVYFSEGDSTVTKITLPQIYGDYYYLKEGRIYQEQSLPVAYLARLHLWKKLFGSAPYSLGVTKDGRILSEQPFISGDPPTQDEVDQFLKESELIPVKAECFVWQSLYFDDTEIWIGDTRGENFVKTEAGLVPIDIRIWIP